MVADFSELQIFLIGKIVEKIIGKFCWDILSLVLIKNSDKDADEKLSERLRPEVLGGNVFFCSWYYRQFRDTGIIWLTA